MQIVFVLSYFDLCSIPDQLIMVDKKLSDCGSFQSGFVEVFMPCIGAAPARAKGRKREKVIY